jgi:hypothetical protein
MFYCSFRTFPETRIRGNVRIRTVCFHSGRVRQICLCEGVILHIGILGLWEIVGQDLTAAFTAFNQYQYQPYQIFER